VYEIHLNIVHNVSNIRFGLTRLNHQPNSICLNIWLEQTRVGIQHGAKFDLGSTSQISVRIDSTKFEKTSKQTCLSMTKFWPRLTMSKFDRS